MGLLETFLIGLCLNSTCIDKTYNFTSNGTLQVQATATPMQKKLYFKYLENQLKGAHLKVATVQNGALGSAVKINGTWFGQGVAFDLLTILQDKYRFNYSVILPKQNALGSKRTGIFSLIYSGKADLAAAFLPITSTYWQYINFATSLDVGEWVVLLKRPQESASGAGILAPFSINVWFLILLSLLIVGPIMYLIISVQYKSNKEQRKISLRECMWFVYGALLKQGTTLTPLSDPTRLMFATWWIFITILTAFYTANLTAFLTLSEFTLPVKNPKDISAKRYPWVTISGSIIEEASSNRREELYRILRTTQKKFVKDNGREILNTWVTKRNYVYIAEKPNVDILLYHDYLNKTKETKRCTYVITPWSIYKSPRTFAYSKRFGSKFGPLFDKTLRDLVEVGLTKYYLTRGLPDVKICPLNLGNKERQLRNTDLLLTYYIVGAGFLIAAIIFTFETIAILLKRRKKRNNKNRKAGRTLRLEDGLNFGKHVPPPPPPPPYDSLFPLNGKKQYINGRDYLVIRSTEGNPVLVPVRTPSALLFQYTN